MSTCNTNQPPTYCYCFIDDFGLAEDVEVEDRSCRMILTLSLRDHCIVIVSKNNCQLLSRGSFLANEAHYFQTGHVCSNRRVKLNVTALTRLFWCVIEVQYVAMKSTVAAVQT